MWPSERKTTVSQENGFAHRMVDLGTEGQHDNGMIMGGWQQKQLRVNTKT